MAGGQGGARRNAGRIPGSKNINIATRRSVEAMKAVAPEISEKAKSMDPLARLEYISLYYYDLFMTERSAAEFAATDEEANEHYARAEQFLKESGQWARESAPFLHAKRGNIPAPAPAADPKKDASADELKANTFGVPPTQSEIDARLN